MLPTCRVSQSGGCRSMTESAVVLVGPMGAGKSTVGALVARRLGRDFIDVDARIVEQQGREISEIFATDGEQEFRRLELEATGQALADCGVVALGGGAVVTPQVREALGGHHVFWLTTSVGEATARMGRDSGRPLLAGNVAANWTRIATLREPLYAEVADHRISTSGQHPDQVARTICQLLEDM